jgi:demethylmenaquinone methyltransferase / 2-methoxy-6-polyprenyl-1,4-benzoquinol methylase
MSSGDLPLDKRPAAVREMFAGVAPRYDLLNHLLSGALDVWWRRRAARALGVGAGGEVLDLCCGTGDQSTALARRGARVVSADFCLPMLALARRKLGGAGGAAPRLATADALGLPFADGRFAGAAVSFGLRNVADLGAALGELARVLAPGGRLAVLEFALPERRWLRGPYLFYFRRVLPLLGRLISPRGSAYTYLPESVLDFPQRQGFTARMEAAGLVDASWQDLTGGTVCLYLGRKPGPPPPRVETPPLPTADLARRRPTGGRGGAALRFRAGDPPRGG